jgi:putative salt-induced outer membrane protein YdiY
MRFLTIALSSLLALADEVTMKNGDRLSGTVLRVDAQVMTLKTDYAGELKLKRESILTFQTEQPVHVLSKDDRSVSLGVIDVKKPDVLVFRTEAEQDKYLRDLRRAKNPGLTELWKGDLDFGYAQARGNTETGTLTAGLRASRTTDFHSLQLNYTSLYSTNAANTIRGGGKYDVKFNPKYYAFLSGDFEIDERQNLDLRLVPGGGLGHNFLRGNGTNWTFFGGASLNREYFSTGLRRNAGEVLAGNDLTHKFAEIFTPSQKTVFYNNVSESGNYRLNADVALAAALRRWLSWQVSTSNRYLSNPLPGRVTNDLLVTTGVRVTFAR